VGCGLKLSCCLFPETARAACEAGRRRAGAARAGGGARAGRAGRARGAGRHRGQAERAAGHRGGAPARGALPRLCVFLSALHASASWYCTSARYACLVGALPQSSATWQLSTRSAKQSELRATPWSRGAQEEASKRAAADEEARAAEARFLELQRRAQEAAVARQAAEARKKREQAQVLGRNGARTKLSFRLG